ncbi:MAG: peptidylprolyl isomerase, partial [Sciscionella sp.]
GKEFVAGRLDQAYGGTPWGCPMRRSRSILSLVVLFAFGGITVWGAQTKSAPAAQGAAAAAGPVIVLDTEKGAIEIETYQKDAPQAVAHVLELVNQGFYRGLRFHWVQAGVIQVGDPLTRNLSRIDAWGEGGSGHPIGVAEISKRSFVRGTVGVFYRNGWEAKTSDSQIFIIKVANPALDGKYIMIGHVTKGMDVADKIVKTDMLKLVSVKG